MKHGERKGGYPDIGGEEGAKLGYLSREGIWDRLAPGPF